MTQEKINKIFVEKGDKKGDKKEGEMNIAKKKLVRRKISAGVLKSYKNNPELRILRSMDTTARLKKGNFGKKNLCRDRDGIFHSEFEIKVKDFLKSLGIEYIHNKHYEQQLFVDDRYYLPDFTFTTRDILPFLDEEDKKYIKGEKKILIEVTESPYATKEGRDKIKDRIQVLSRLKNVSIFIITYPNIYKNYAALYINNPKVHVFSYGDPELNLDRRRLVFKPKTIDYAHFLSWHLGKCRNLHGHTCELKITVRGIVGLDEDKPWLVDFAILKEKANEVCDLFDHKTIIGTKNIKVSQIINNKVTITIKNKKTSIIKELNLDLDSVVFIDGDSTAETLCRLFAELLMDKMPKSIEEITVEWSEGKNNTAIFSLDRPYLEERNIEDKNQFLNAFIYHLRARRPRPLGKGNSLRK